MAHRIIKAAEFISYFDMEFWKGGAKFCNWKHKMLRKHEYNRLLKHQLDGKEREKLSLDYSLN